MAAREAAREAVKVAIPQRVGGKVPTSASRRVGPACRAGRRPSRSVGRSTSRGAVCSFIGPPWTAAGCPDLPGVPHGQTGQKTDVPNRTLLRSRRLRDGSRGGAPGPDHLQRRWRATRASTVASTSAASVIQFETEMRMAGSPAQTVGVG